MYVCDAKVRYGQRRGRADLLIFNACVREKEFFGLSGVSRFFTFLYIPTREGWVK